MLSPVPPIWVPQKESHQKLWEAETIIGSAVRFWTESWTNRFTPLRLCFLFFNDENNHSEMRWTTKHMIESLASSHSIRLREAQWFRWQGRWRSASLSWLSWSHRGRYLTLMEYLHPPPISQTLRSGRLWVKGRRIISALRQWKTQERVPILVPPLLCWWRRCV